VIGVRAHRLIFGGCVLLAVAGFGSYAWLGREISKVKYGPVTS
jgi:hypothetical protein